MRLIERINAVGKAIEENKLMPDDHQDILHKRKNSGEFDD